MYMRPIPWEGYGRRSCHEFPSGKSPIAISSDLAANELALKAVFRNCSDVVFRQSADDTDQRFLF